MWIVLGVPVDGLTGPDRDLVSGIVDADRSTRSSAVSAHDTLNPN